MMCEGSTGRQPEKLARPITLPERSRESSNCHTRAEVLLRALNAETDSAFFQSDAARRLAEKKATDSHSAALRAAARRRHAGAL